MIEDKASGTQLIQDLIGSGPFAVLARYAPDGDKVMRLHAQIGGDRERLRLSCPTAAPWRRRLLRRAHDVSPRGQQFSVLVQQVTNTFGIRGRGAAVGHGRIAVGGDIGDAFLSASVNERVFF